MYQIEEYQTEDGSRPFAEWRESLPDKQAQTKINTRLARARLGNLGDWKALLGTSGICEMREHYGPGYRIYFSFKEGRIILLLAGSTKRDQRRMIAKAQQYLADYEQRIGR